MGYPAKLTEEEQALVNKYALIKKKVCMLMLSLSFQCPALVYTHQNYLYHLFFLLIKRVYQNILPHENLFF